MRYLLRAVKYFIQINIILFVIMTALVLTGFVDKDVNVMFSHGWTSVYMIIGFFATVSAFYPLFGYKRYRIEGPEDKLLEVMDGYLEEKGYRKECSEDEKKTYRARSFANRLFRLFEDRVSFEKDFGSWYIEGAARDIVRIKSGLEYKMQFDG